MSEAAGPIIEAKEISKSFRGKRVLDRMDLTVERGETLVIIGQSGCGKSVFLKHLIGLLLPDSGHIRVAGTDWAKLSPRETLKMRLRFGMLFQGAALFDSLTVGENVGFGLIEHSDLPEGEIRARVAEALGYVGLAGIEALKPAELSGGMRKRVGLARAICMKPEIVLYDEPTTGLDPINADAINNLIVELQHKLKITSVAVTHDMASVYKIASRIAMMYQGRVVQVGRTEEIRNSPNPIVRQFITGSAKGPITDAAEKRPKGERAKAADEQ